jgi:hypothetical protein
MFYKRCKFGCDRSIIKGTLLEEPCASSSVSRLPLEGCSWKLIPHTLHACATNSARLARVSLTKDNLGTEHLFGCISTSIPGIFLKIHTSHFARMSNKRWNFGCERSLIKETLLGKQSTFFGSISAFIGGIFLEVHLSHFPLMRYKRCKFGCDPSLIKGTLLVAQSTFSALSRLQGEEFSWGFIISTFLSCTTNGANMVALRQ